MPAEETCWTMIRGAAGGDPAARERFARVYLPVVKAYLTARWRTQRRDPNDAVQDVFVECFRQNGLLNNADSERAGGFRAYLLGAVRNVARRHESRVRPTDPLPLEIPADDTGPAEAFDRAWARALLREAARRQREDAAQAGEAALRRVDLLQLRFQDGLPIREIAERWGVDAAKLHHEYATARDEYRTALRTVVAFHQPNLPNGDLDKACGELLALLR